ncbi:hypothetical protein SAMN04489761_0865 [Tenacibaculum sp. MAR_2009_124]|uniref:hypothetical protein n=1 Tax=Tenacibaculum sp. MAR_2009_124 TaxID=1250059 RepID=UPI00089629B2|nr:hypothetical protein [Tenacibaculum sp. MAR_2009_124]SEB46332.1 hypothetical protein SAMN04489761_0865 [Tenacibaculum sp. MAR_2009_124]
MKTTMKIAVIAMMAMSLGVKAQLYAPEIEVKSIEGNGIGIKTESPNRDADLHIRDSRASLFLENTNANNWAFFRIKGTGSNFWDIGQYGDNDYLEFRPKASSANRLFLRQNGNLGIKGLPSDDADLHIRDSRASLFLENTNANNWAFFRIKGTGSNFWDIGQYGDNDYLEFRPKASSVNRIKIFQNGTLSATTFKAVSPPWADFVFKDNYDLPSLQEVEKHIKSKGHLRDIPSASEVQKNGINLGEMDAKLLQKIEELTLYTIEQEKEIEELKKQNSEIKEQQRKIEKLESLVQKLLKDKN